MAYNGWSTYETWCVYTWLTNDEATFNTCRSIAGECGEVAPQCEQVEQHIWTVQEAMRFTLADRLKELIEDGNPLTEDASLYSDLLEASISDVNWHELSDAFLKGD